MSVLALSILGETRQVRVGRKTQYKDEPSPPAAAGGSSVKVMSS